MAQTIQIVPKYSFPYVETVINDYTEVSDNLITNSASDDIVRYIFPFVSSKGIDNRFIRKRTRNDIISTYGDSNYKKYGQPLMQALNVAEATNTEVWCMRVMPDDATYAYNTISAYYKADNAEDVPTASKRKFRIKYVPNASTKTYTTIKEIKDDALKLDGQAVDGIYTDSEGYIQIPGVFNIYSAGRGKYGNDYRIRINQEIYYEKDYGIKFYTFEVISTENGINKTATYVGTASTSTKYSQTTLINDVLEDVDDGIVPVYINIDEDGIADLYNAYVTWIKALKEDLETELAGITGNTEEDENNKLNIESLITEASNIPELDQFDAIFGRKVASNNTIPFIELPTVLTPNVTLKEGDDEETYIHNAAYTTSNIIDFDGVTGARLNGGSDGSFENVPKGKTLDDIVTECYIKAFNGTYDKRILTSKRIKANALWDANYSFDVKKEMAALATIRKDAICYLDSGIMSSFGKTELDKLINDYSVFNTYDDDINSKKLHNYTVSKNVHHYYIKEPTTNKRVPVTITYFLSRQYADHIMNYGNYIPFVKSYAQLSGHVKDSLAPSVEDFEVELKETLTNNRFNFFETIDDNVYQRATQNTAQMITSDLLEENNVAVLYDMKRIVEADINDRQYDFTDAEARQRFRTYEKAKFADWSGRDVQSFDIDFRMNAWEAERSILHAYIDVTFRGLQKRAILEIDVNKRQTSETEE